MFNLLISVLAALKAHHESLIPSSHCMYEVTVNGGVGQPGLCEGSHLGSSERRWQWPVGRQAGHNHLTLEKQSDTLGFNALPWV